MDGAPTVYATLALGFALGMAHALDADHLLAVATLVTERPSPARAAAIGAMWGLGHGAALGAAGAVMVLFRCTVPPWLATWLELVVAALLIGLGIQAVRRGLRAATHVHVHRHDGTVHAHRHVHVHADRHADGDHGGVLHAMAHAGRRPFLVGIAHGLAGSAALALLVVGTIASPAAAFAYLAVFAFGAVVGMTALSALVSVPMALAASRLGRLHRRLEVAIGAGGIAFGVVVAVRLVGRGMLG
jgi:ABC-type nickel/cobalt efflux system permease component RcnA